MRSLPLLRRTAGRLALSATLAGSVLLAGCSGDDEPSDGASTDPAKVAQGEQLEPLATWPLTGELVGRGTAERTRPVLVVKMDNTSSSAPQIGLSKADLVVEELVEGGVTRLAAMYYQQDLPTKVGPVRSMRASDIGIVTPVGADVVTSGAASITIQRISDAGIRFFNEGAPGFFRDDTRAAPYNLFDDLRRTAQEAETQQAVRPPDYLPWGSPEDLPRGRRADGLSAVFSAGHTTTWAYEGDANDGEGGYVDQGSNAAEGDRFTPDTVLVLRVEEGDAGYLDPAGNPVPETRLTGSGSATLFHGGRVVGATWAKKALDAPLVLSTGPGRKKVDLVVPTGHVWIELLPRDGGDLQVTR